MTSKSSVYAFVGWLASMFLYACFLLWVFSTDNFLHSIGISYYPSRYYAIAIPSYCIVVYILSGIFYVGLNMINTHDPSSILTISDEYSKSVSCHFSRCSDVDGIVDFGDIHPMSISLSLLEDNDFKS